jgi:hypothetical protein
MSLNRGHFQPLLPSSKVSYTEFICPFAHETFSSEYFDKITFAQVEELDHYPTIAPVHSTIRQEFSQEVPASASATVIVPNEVIPNILDLKRTLSGMEAAFFQEGARSVLVEFEVDGTNYTKLYLFKKVRAHFSF